jgi:hypothetical protein
MPLILLKKPAPCKGTPSNRQYATAFGFNFVPDPVLIDKMHDDPDTQTSSNGPEQDMQLIHKEPTVASFWPNPRYRANVLRSGASGGPDENSEACIDPLMSGNKYTLTRNCAALLHRARAEAIPAKTAFDERSGQTNWPSKFIGMGSSTPN